MNDLRRYPHLLALGLGLAALPLAGCSADEDSSAGAAPKAVETLADQQDSPLRVEVAAGRVFWSSPGHAGEAESPGYLRSSSRSGQGLRTLHDGSVSAIGIIDGRLYWAKGASNSIEASPLTTQGAAETIIPEAGKVVALIRRQDDVTWTARGPEDAGPGLARAPLRGGEAEIQVAYRDLREPGFLAAGADAFYLADVGRRVIYAVSPNLPQRTIDAGFDTLGHLVANDQALYFTDSGDGMGRVLRLAHGAEQAEVIAGDLPGAFGIALDEQALYVTTSSPDGACRGQEPAGAIWRIPLAGGAPVSIATDQACPLDIAVDDRAVYWVNAGLEGVPNSGAVLRAPKR